MLKTRMLKGLIGYTGFVGGNLLKTTSFDYTFNSKNIDAITNIKFDQLVCAAPSAVKWKANKEPAEDQKLIDNLIAVLKKVRTRQIIYTSTIDVYKSPINMNEDSPMITSELHPYGLHRLEFEKFFRENFPKSLIIRLPALFGPGLKKNIIFDFLNNNCLDLIHKDSQFQFYDLANLWKDIQIALQNQIQILNITSEPICVSEIAKECFNIEFTNVTSNPPAKYDIEKRDPHGSKKIYSKLPCRNEGPKCIKQSPISPGRKKKMKRCIR